ncbi:MAG: hypothetical protein J5496_09220, partial [Lachnospiraceae bacterium]|nr:hypothetical protein [Lachnospiraceae bacterium]
EDCSFTTEVIAPTETEQGYTKHTCTVCGYSYNSDYTDPIPASSSEEQTEPEVPEIPAGTSVREAISIIDATHYFTYFVIDIETNAQPPKKENSWQYDIDFDASTVDHIEKNSSKAITIYASIVLSTE